MVSSGKRINTPSDDPVGAGQVAGYRRIISSIGQYKKNISHARAWLSATDSALDNVDNLLIQAKGIASSQATGTANRESRAAAAEQVKGIYNQILQLSNSKLGDSYIFSGHRASTPAFASNGTYQGDNGSVMAVTGENVSIKINMNGNALFKTGTDMFDVINSLETALSNNDAGGISNQLTRLDDALNQIANARGTVGAKLKQLDNTDQYWDDFNMHIQGMLSDTEDVDITKAMTDLVQKQTAYQSSLQTASMIVQASLVNFLR
jgi:flagellar hook-associated protein 3 FlgL